VTIHNHTKTAYVQFWRCTSHAAPWPIPAVERLRPEPD